MAHRIGGRLAWFAVLAACAPSAPVPARAADEIGLYFDERGDQPCAELPAAYVFLNMYLLLLDPSAGGGVAGWECTLDLSSNVQLNSSALVLAGNGLNVDSPPYFQVGIGGLPLPRAQVVELARFSVFVTATGPSAFFVYPYRIPSIEGATTPVYAAGPDGSTLLPMTPRALSGGALVAGVNLPECIKEAATWSRIKRVYDD